MTKPLSSSVDSENQVGAAGSQVDAAERRLAELSPERRALLALKLKKRRAETARQRKITPGGKRDRAPISFAQQRLWFLDQLEPGSAAYNLHASISLSGRLDLVALERTLNEVVRRHEALRTCFAAGEGEPVQVILPELRLELPLHDLRHLPEGAREERARQLAEEEVGRAFDLREAPLLRASVLRLGEQEHIVLLTMHHVVSDGWSMGVLVREVAALYAAYSQGEESPLAALPIQYADYSVWQRQYLRGEVLEQQLAYWREQLAGAEPLELPIDHPRPAVQSYRGAGQMLRVDEEVTRGLKELGREEGATLFMVLLAAFQLLLMRYSGQGDISVGTPVAGRSQAELEPLIGFSST